MSRQIPPLKLEPTLASTSTSIPTSSSSTCTSAISDPPSYSSSPSTSTSTPSPSPSPSPSPGPQTTPSLPLPYTSSPVALFLSDLALWIRLSLTPPGPLSILLPFYPFRSGKLDELYPSPRNLVSLAWNLALTVVQVLFLVSLVPAAFFGVGFPLGLGTAYTPVWILWVGAVVGGNWVVGGWFNGVVGTEVRSRIELGLSEEERRRGEGERFVFVNGVAAGEHWMQSNLDRLALTFRRDIYGVHNPTRGIIFDLLECVLERTFSYPTPSTRMVYSRLLDIISDPKLTRIVLILHSQGAIEGGLALDWLFATVPTEQVSCIEVYTFGSAANHFNNPALSSMDTQGRRFDLKPGSSGDDRAIRHIEHYANSGDFISRFGILHFRPMPGMEIDTLDSRGQKEAENRYFGRLFIRRGTGHQFNGNYLDDMFSFSDKTFTHVADNNDFMDGIVETSLLEYDIVVSQGTDIPCLQRGKKQRNGKQCNGNSAMDQNVRVKDLSRLWQYRNGGVPTT